MDIFYPIEWFAGRVVFDLLKLSPTSQWGDSLNFFIYDTIKISLLLLVINFLMAVVRHYLPVEKLKDFLTKRNWYGLDYLMAAFFGVITPFCSCSSIPLFIGFVSAGIPLGVTFTFLITSPLVNEASLVLFAGLFGIKIAILYAIAGMAIGVIGGWVLGKMNLEKYIDPSILAIRDKPQKKFSYKETSTFSELIKKWWQEGLVITKQLIPYVVGGIAVGALIHGFVPQNFFEKFLVDGSWWSVPLAAIVAVPLYSNAVGVIPIMEALVAKGVPFGTGLAFMMATVGLSLPEALILKKAMRVPLLITFFATVTIGIILIGYLFNAIF